ncbi:MAG: hypothetical protein ACHQ1D_00335 [Nitrososphaerales archaeon]
MNNTPVQLIGLPLDEARAYINKHLDYEEVRYLHKDSLISAESQMGRLNVYFDNFGLVDFVSEG